MSALKYKSLPFRDVKAGGDGSTFEGYCAAFSNCDSWGDVIMPGAFKDTLDDFLANGLILFNHGELIGKPLDAKEDAKGLFIKGAISDTARGRDVKTLLKDGVLRKMSIGYRGLGRKPTNADDVKAYWTSIGHTPSAEDLFNVDDNRNCLSFLTAIKLYEASPVGFPANTLADITDVKGGPLRLSQLKALVAELKAGRVLSKANHARLTAVHDAIAPACKDLKDLLDTFGVSAETDDDAEEANSAPTEGDDDDADPKTAACRKTRGQLLLLAKARAELAFLHLDPLFTATDLESLA